MNRAVLFFHLTIIVIVLFLSGCSTTLKPRVVKFKKVNFEDLNGWYTDHQFWAFESFKNSCEKIMSTDAEKAVSNLTKIGGNAIDWQVPCIEAAFMPKPSNAEAREFFERWFIPYQAYNEEGEKDGVLTGYYQIELEGSRKKCSRFKYPVYKKPNDLHLLKGNDGIEHASINRGVLAGKNLELAWVDNRAKLYLMHIQGSGIVKLREGGEYFLGFDGHNGFKFKGISEAVRNRALKFASSEALYDWVHKNPHLSQEILEEDPSYVFFRRTDYNYAAGGQGVPLRPERSIAVDSGLYPYGSPVWVESDLSESKAFIERQYNRLFIAQDTGGAIRGAVRGDVFFGRGRKAEKVAHSFKTKTNFYLLFPKTVSVPESYTAF